MDEINELLCSSWGAEKWLLEGWNQINVNEKLLIKDRMHDLFKDGLPFELKHDKLLYIHTFSFLAQVEVLAIQIPLKFESKMTTPILKQRMRTQLLDEIFHGLVFTKIVYLLCEPYSMPPAYNEGIEQFCNFIRNEDCPKIAVVLVNLVAEGWIEELFKSLKSCNIAPKVFDIILEDEHRHVCEAELYNEIGLPDQEIMLQKLLDLEDHLLSNILFQYTYGVSFRMLLGVQGMRHYIDSLNKKHTKQLAKINASPGKKWALLMNARELMSQHVQQHTPMHHQIEMTPTRKFLMTQWRTPDNPTMLGQFNLNVSCLDLFDKKHPPHLLTILMLQTISQLLADVPELRSFLSHNQLYQSQYAYVGLVIKVPHCGDQLGNIVVANAHTQSVRTLTAKIKRAQKMMAYCFKKREQLERDHPHLRHIHENLVNESEIYPCPVPGNPVVNLTNLSSYGYTQGLSPLRKNEALIFAFFEVERKQVWNQKNRTFEVQDLLPVSVSADHRVMDGNIPCPKLIEGIFQRMVNRHEAHSDDGCEQIEAKKIMLMIDELFNRDLQDSELRMAHTMLMFLQTSWPDYINVDELFNSNAVRQFAFNLMMETA